MEFRLGWRRLSRELPLRVARRRRPWIASARLPPSSAPGLSDNERVDDEHAEIAEEIRRFAAEASTLDADDRRARYLELVKRAHPDGPGSDDLLRSLVDAYEQSNFETTSKGSMDMVVRQALAGELTRSRSDELAVRRHDSKRVVSDLVRHHTSGLAQAKRQGRAASLAIAGVAALVALLRTLGLDQVEVTNVDGERVEQSWISPTARVLLFSVLAVLTAVIALLAWRASARAAWIEGAIEDAASTLGDKNSYLRALVELRRDGALGAFWSHDELRDAVHRWVSTDQRGHRPRGLLAVPIFTLVRARAEPQTVPLRSLASVCGASDFANLLIVKGLERELLLEEKLGTPEQPQFSYRIA